MHELKTGLINADKLPNFFYLSGKVFSFILFANDPHTLYNRLNASRLARFRKTRKQMNRGKTYC